MQDAVEAFGEYKSLERQLADAREMLKESDGALRRRPAAVGCTLCCCVRRRLPAAPLTALPPPRVLFTAAAAAGDPEMAELAREEVDTLSAAIEEQGERLKLLLLPRDPLDEKNIMLEVRRRCGRPAPL